MLNPIKRVREDHHLTMKALASLAGVTEQNVVRAESGMFGSLPPSIVDAISTLTGDSADRVHINYQLWVEAELKEVELPTAVSDKMILDRVTFKDWKKAVCALNGMPDTTVGFCKLFKLHPYVIDKWEGGKLKSAPLQLVQRLAYMRGIL